MDIRKNLLAVFCLCSVFLSAYAQNMVTVKPSDPNIQYIGRIDDSNPDNIVFAFPGVSIRAKFEGERIDAFLTEYGHGTETTTNYFNVIIDGGEPTVLKLSSSQTTYTLASGLSHGEHTVELFKRTESNVGKVAFSGFQLAEGNSLLQADDLPDRKIEFIGNSITCGYGNEVSTTDPANFPFTSVNENNYKAWGAVAARSLNAQYSCVAYSGRGLMQNNDGSVNGVLPKIYNQVIADDASVQWDTKRYVPDIIVINLGTNDFAAETWANAPVTETAFVNAYISFINDLRTQYPCVSIICCVGTMMSDYYPAGANQWTRIQEYVSSVRDYFNNQGDSKVYYLMLEPQESPYGEDYHPTAATDAKMASTLVDFINSSVSWEGGSELPLAASPLVYTVGDAASALEAEGQNLRWYNKAGLELAGAPTPNTSAEGTTSYYVSQTTGDCESGLLEIQVQVKQAETAPVLLKAGWNLIGCPIKGETAVEKALSSIWNNTIELKNMDAFYNRSVEPVYNLLSTVKGGYGYLIKVDADCELIWNQ